MRLATLGRFAFLLATVGTMTDVAAAPPADGGPSTAADTGFFDRWESGFGAGSDWRFTAVAATDDAIFVAGNGRTQADPFLLTWLGRFDPNGEVVTQHILDADASQVWRMAPTLEGGVAIAGTFGVIAGGTGMISVLDADLNPLWAQGFPGQPFQALAASEGGYAALRRVDSAGNGLELVVLDGSGNVLFGRAYSLAGHLFSSNELGLAPGHGGGYVLAATIRDDATNAHDGWIALVDADGQIVTQHTIGAAANDFVWDVASTPTGYVAVGRTDSFGTATDHWALVFDAELDLISAHAYGGNRTDELIRVGVAADGDIVAAGFTASDPYNFSTSAAVLLRLDPDGDLVSATGIEASTEATRTLGMAPAPLGGAVVVGQTGVAFAPTDAFLARLGDAPVPGCDETMDVTSALTVTSIAPVVSPVSVIDTESGVTSSALTLAFAPSAAEAIRICPEDADEDGVIDDEDECPDTPPDTVVLPSNGCSIAQLAPCEGPWRNHGAYVVAVSRTARLFVAAGLISEGDADLIVSAAARSDCGRWGTTTGGGG